MSRVATLQVASLTSGNRVARALWSVAYALLYRPTPRFMHPWRRFLLRLFGARIARGAHPYSRARIWAPWNLEMHENSCIADDVDCYCVAPVTIGRNATVSQYSYLCTASHDYRDPAMQLIAAPIVVAAEAWVAADVFVGPGVTIGEGAVVGARASVHSDVEPWAVMTGSPAQRRGTRPKVQR